MASAAVPSVFVSSVVAECLFSARRSSNFRKHTSFSSFLTVLFEQLLPCFIEPIVAIVLLSCLQ